METTLATVGLNDDLPRAFVVGGDDAFARKVEHILIQLLVFQHALILEFGSQLIGNGLKGVYLRL